MRSLRSLTQDDGSRGGFSDPDPMQNNRGAQAEVAEVEGSPRCGHKLELGDPPIKLKSTKNHSTGIIRFNVPFDSLLK